MQPNKFIKVVFTFLILSAIFGIYILVEDAVIGPPNRVLWADNWIWAPIPHASGLVAMVVIDMVLAGLLVYKPSPFIKLVLLWGIIQVIIMALDPFTGSFYIDALVKAADEDPEKIVPEDFRNFLVNLTPDERRDFLEKVFNPQSFANYLFNIPGFVARFVGEILVVVTSVLAIRSK